MTHPAFTRTAAAVLATSTVVALAGCSTPGADTPGVTEDTVTIGSHQPLTGPAAASYAPVSAGMAAYFDYINANGGINGRTIEFLNEDDGYNPANTQTVVRDLVLDEGVFAIVGGLGTPTHSSVLDFLNDNDVPDLFASSGSTSWNQPDTYPDTFGFQTSYETEGMILATYAQETYPGSTFCVLGQDDEFGTDLTAGVESVLGEGSLAEVQVYSTSTPDVAAQIVAMQAAGCEVNFLGTITGFTALAIGTGAQLGYFPKWVSSSSGADYGPLVGYLGDSGPALLEGFVSSNFLPSASDTSSEWITLFQQVNDEYGGDTEFNGAVVYGMSIAYAFAQALALAGDNPTRESLIEAVESGGVTGSGVVPMVFSDTVHQGYTGGNITIVSDGAQLPTGDAFVRAGDGLEVYTGGPSPLENAGIPTA